MESPSITSLLEDNILLSPMHSVVFDTSEIEVGEGINGNNNEINKNDDNNHDNHNDDNNSLVLDDCSYTSNEFYGTDMLDYTSFEDESEWYQYLNEIDRLELQRGETKVQAEDWTDRLISDVGEDCEFFLDSSKKEAMDYCSAEIKHIERRLKRLLKKTTMIPSLLMKSLDWHLAKKVTFLLLSLRH